MALFHHNKHYFDTVYSIYADMVYRLALSYLNHMEDAQDVVQDVFTKYMCGFHLPMDKEHEKAWFIRVTINRCHDCLRRKKHRTHASLDEIENIADYDKEMPYMLLETLQKLPEKYRTIIILHYLEGYSVSETASLCRISVSAAKMRLLRGREILKKTIKN